MKRKKIQSIFYLLIVLSILIFPNITMLYNTINRQAKYSCSASLDAEDLVIDKGFSQWIHLNDQAESIGIYLSGGGTDTSKLKVQITQEDYTYEEILEVNQEDFYYVMIPALKKGDFCINLLSMTRNSDVLVKLSNDLTFGSFPYGNGYRSLKLDITTSYHMPYLKLKLVLIFVSIILGILSCYELFYKERIKWIPFFSMGIILCQLLCKYTITLLSNDAVFELSSVYIGSIFSSGWKGFWLDDAGYMPFFLKILCLILVKGFHILRYTPLILSLVSTITIAAILSFLTGPRFQEIADIKRRFLFTLILGCTQILIVQSQIVLPINMAYFGGLLVIYIYLLDLEKQDKSVIPWMFFSGLLVMSKGSFVVMIPVLLIILVITFCKKYRKTLLYTLYLLTALLFQCIYVVVCRPDMLKTAQGILGRMLRSVWVYLLTTQKWLFRSDNNTDTIALFILILLFHISMFLYTFRLCHRKERWGILLLSVQAISFGQIIINGTGFIHETGLGLDYMRTSAAFRYEKNSFFVELFILTVAFTFIAKTEKTVMQILVLALFIGGISLYPEEEYTANSQGNWNDYSTIMSSNTYAIPYSGYSENTIFIKNNSYICYIGGKDVVSGELYKNLWGVDQMIVDKEAPGFTDTYDLPATTRKLLAVYGFKSFVSQTDDIWCIFRDSEKNVLAKVKLATASERKITGYGVLLQTPIEGAATLSFVDCDENPICLRTGCYIVWEQ